MTRSSACLILLKGSHEAAIPIQQSPWPRDCFFFLGLILIDKSFSITGEKGGKRLLCFVFVYDREGRIKSSGDGGDLFFFFFLGFLVPVR